MTSLLRSQPVFLISLIISGLLTGLFPDSLQAQTITTVAGNGMGGFSGDGGPATQAKLSVINVAVDQQGALYLVDEEHQRIRKVAPNGVITTLAGNGGFGYGGDGGLATNAMLKYPAAVTVDAQGNVLIADRQNQRIRKVTPNGIIRTVAGTGAYGFGGDGGPAPQAKMSSPRGMAVDAQGTIFFADRENNRVRKITTNGTISTVAGSGAYGFGGDGGLATRAKLAYPTELALDAQGNLFIADEANFRIRKVTPSGIITTVVGSGHGGYDGDGGMATRASVGFPCGIAVDGQGNLFIADRDNLRIRKVTPGGLISTVAGDGTEGFRGDGGPASNAQLSYPAGLAVNAQGDLLIADSGNNRVRKLMAVTQPLAVASFSLINADTEQEIKRLSEGETLDLASLPTRNLNIRANIQSEPVGSIKLVLSGRQSRTQVDNAAPYALFGDKSSNFNAWTPTVGSYSLTATAYTQSGAAGTAGSPLTITFRVVNQTPQAKISSESNSEEAELKVYPNPFRDAFTLERAGKNPAAVPVVLYDAAGRKVWEAKAVESGQLIRPGSSLSPGVYLLQVGEGAETQRQKLLRIP